MTAEHRNGSRLIPIYFLTPDGVVVTRSISTVRAKQMYKNIKASFKDTCVSERGALEIELTDPEGKTETLFVLDIWVNITDVKTYVSNYISAS